MKQLLFILTLLIGTCFATHAKTIKLVPSALDSTRMDTVVISDLQDVNEDQNAAMHDISSDFGDWNSGPPTSVAIVALIICCGLPFFIVAIVLWFRYKNKQAKYKLAAEALAAGRTIPAELFNDPEEQGNAVMTKGIKNIFLGIGLGVFLWVLTAEEHTDFLTGSNRGNRNGTERVDGGLDHHRTDGSDGVLKSHGNTHHAETIEVVGTDSCFLPMHF